MSHAVPKQMPRGLHLSTWAASLAAATALVSCVDLDPDSGDDPSFASTTSALHVGTGVRVTTDQSDTQYHFVVTVPTVNGANYVWSLVHPNGFVEFIQSSGTNPKIDLTFPTSKFEPGEYWFLVTNATSASTAFQATSDGFLLPLLAVSPDVGVIPNDRSCPASTATINIHMDNEDSRPASGTSGWVGGTFVDGNATFVFCRVDGNRFASLSSQNSASSNYAVLRLGAHCPSGSIPFSRFFDNEDDSNDNWSAGNISPNTNIGNSNLNFCLFAGGSSTAPLPDLGFSYGVFAAPGFAFGIQHGAIFNDDEDNNNTNGYVVDPSWQTAAQAIIVPGGNTTLNTARIGTCNDHLCTGGETPANCPADCDECGNGICRANETVFNCPQDCAVCGDGICSPGEFCDQDCNSSCDPTTFICPL